MKVAGSGDRRAPVARYVEFGDERVQARFVADAENAYRVLLASDSFEGLSHVDVRAAPLLQREGPVRRPEAAPAHVVPATPGLARVASAATNIPRELESLSHGCTASRRVARVLAAVATDLVGDLLALDPAEQAAHPAYRQTLRLAAELEGVRDIVSNLGCTDPDGCLAIRPPQDGGRRGEDGEVMEVRAVLHRLALAGNDYREHE